ncbi:uncharacterized protein LOC110854240 [Folsomia candida]|uniref:uncharacterized protein LOC110854240 n=1 Tax=Folsomia candida TaxID=158441 RepID=UPI000B8FD96F|nr:uncharacterized protein LOC110854240 [Folsomia candida]
MCKIFALASALVVVVGATALNPAGRAEDVAAIDTSKFQPLTCRNGTYGPSDVQAGRMATECTNYGVEAGQQNPNCVYFCQSEILGLLNTDGLPSRIGYDTFAEHTIVPEYRTMAIDWFRECFDKYGDQIDKTDTECKAAGQLNTCTWSIQPKLIC